MKFLTRMCWVGFLFVACMGCGEVATTTQEPVPTSTAGASAQPGFQDLMEGFDFNGPQDESIFAVPEAAIPAKFSFEGRLELLNEATQGEMQVLRGELEPGAAHLPEFDFTLVQSGDALIPTQRGMIITDHPYWNYILEPGKVWRLQQDQGYSRAALPFALVWKGSNAVFNGSLTFLFNDQGISKVWYQVTQETTTYTQANLWGLLDAVYHPGAVQNADQIRAAYATELAERYPTKPIEQLAADYPGVDLSAFGQGVSPQHMTWYGVVMDGTNYVGGCQTRFGQYAFCESMRTASYSTAKSMFASLSLMRLSQKYQMDAGSLLIKDYVPESEHSPGDWSQVTFNHTIDMATGNFRSAAYMVDEEHFDTDPFWLEEYYPEKIAAAFNWPHSASPGTTWVYRTFDTFILTSAMQNYLRFQEGDQADIYQLVVDEVYRPLQIGPGAYTTQRTRDGNWQGLPYGGYGLWWVPDDIAKIGTLLNNRSGVIDGVQVLETGMLASAMQQNPQDRGVRIDSRRMYNNAFWAQVYGKTDGFNCEFWVPHMLGISGNVVLLLPNGVIYYYFSDNQEFTWQAAMRAINQIKPLCE